MNASHATVSPLRTEQDTAGARGAWEPSIALRRSEDLVRTAVVGSHLSFCEALAIALMGHGAFAVDAVVASGDEIPRGVVEADIVVLDVELEGAHAAPLVEAIVSQARGRVVLVTSARQHHLWRRALTAGAAGVVPKTAPLEQLVRSLLAVAAGQLVAPPAALTAQKVTRSANGMPVATLTDRETEILSLCAAGMSTAKIAEHLVVSRNTVRTHVQNVLGKLDARSRLEAVAIGLSMGLVDPPDRDVLHQ